MTHTFARVLSATVLGAVLTGCATVPGDPYYAPAPYYPPSTSTIIYDSPPVYRAAPPVYVAPPPAVYYGNRRDDRDWARERERAREQADRDRRDRDRDRDRDNARRDQEQRRNQAEHDRRNQAERDKRAAAERARNENRPSQYGPAPNDWRARTYKQEPGAGP